jgi:hypothetical protein
MMRAPRTRGKWLFKRSRHAIKYVHFKKAQELPLWRSGEVSAARCFCDYSISAVTQPPPLLPPLALGESQSLLCSVQHSFESRWRERLSTMGRRKQHCPKRAAGDEDPEEEGNYFTTRLTYAYISILSTVYTVNHNDQEDEDAKTIDLAAKWIQLQAQFALRLQQSAADEAKHKQNNELLIALHSPLDLTSVLNSRSLPPLPVSSSAAAGCSPLMSFASMMDKSPWSTSAAASLTALQKITQLTQRSPPTHHISFPGGVHSSRFGPHPAGPLLFNPPSSPLKTFPWQSRYNIA